MEAFLNLCLNIWFNKVRETKASQLRQTAINNKNKRLDETTVETTTNTTTSSSTDVSLSGQERWRMAQLTRAAVPVSNPGSNSLCNIKFLSVKQQGSL